MRRPPEPRKGSAATTPGAIFQVLRLKMALFVVLGVLLVHGLP